RLPGLPAVARALDDLPEPAARLRGEQAVRVGPGALHMIDLPAGEVGPADVPLPPFPVRRQYERALAGPHQYPNTAHVWFPPVSSLSLGRGGPLPGLRRRTRSRPIDPQLGGEFHRPVANGLLTKQFGAEDLMAATPTSGGTMTTRDWSRREFLEVSAAAAGVSLAPKALGTIAAGSADKVRFGMIGIGMQGSSLLTESIRLPG